MVSPFGCKARHIIGAGQYVEVGTSLDASKGRDDAFVRRWTKLVGLLIPAFVRFALRGDYLAPGPSKTMSSGEVDWVQIDLEQDSHDHLIPAKIVSRWRWRGYSWAEHFGGI
jgi:hypothetical protein